MKKKRRKFVKELGEASVIYSLVGLELGASDKRECYPL
jgi:hypothetical protein